jgi:ADP-heptose:LPS heptosyltransferase
MEGRGNSLLRLLDQYLGLLILGFLAIALKFKRLFGMHKSVESDSCLLVCFGAIGDLIVLTTAAKQQLAGKKVYLVCSGLNHPCALLYSDFYKGIERVDLKSLFSVYRSCKKFGVNQIIDSTQWANIGPIMVGIAALLNGSIASSGFRSKSISRNAIYDQTVLHSREIHEVANFTNLMAGYGRIVSNTQLPNLLPDLYQQKTQKSTQKILLHLWPSGARSYLKEWPETYWQELAKYLMSQGYVVYLSGAPSDYERTNDFIKKSELPLINVAGSFDLKGLLQFLRDEIEIAVSVNTGILHLLVDAGIPTIGLHGPTNPERWGPLGSPSIALLPLSGPSAYLHYGFEYPEADEDVYSLNKLTVAQVMEAIAKLQAHA